MKTIGRIILLFAIFLFFRTVNIDDTARFTHDESSDLLRMQQYWQTKRITLIGPISTDNTKVFGSLTYYMLLPFAAVGGFDPIGPVYGTAFWGALTALILVLLTVRTDKPMLFATVILGCIWYPLLETSRWAWNPHLVLFWISLALLITTYKARFVTQLAIGLFFGLSIHHHYIALFATGTFILIQSFIFIKNKRMTNAFGLLLGYSLAILPFILFDLRHPPGLFIGRYLLSGATPHVAEVSGAIAFFGRGLSSTYISAFTLSRSTIFAILTIIGTLTLVSFDFISKGRKWWRYTLPVLAQLLSGVLLTQYETRYFLPALPFYFLWLIQPRSGISKVAQRILLAVILISSLLTVYPQLTVTKTQPSIKIIRESTQYIQTIYNNNPLKNVNITTVASPDNDLVAMKYRDVLALKQVPLRAPSEYDATENLFVISTSPAEVVRIDASVPLQIFRNAKQVSVTQIENSPWKVYHLSF